MGALSTVGIPASRTTGAQRVPTKQRDPGFPEVPWWTRLQPIRTAAEVALEFAVSTHEPFIYQRIAAEVRRMRRLGMTLQAIGGALGVDEKTVRNVLRMGTNGARRAGAASRPRPDHRPTH